MLGTELPALCKLQAVHSLTYLPALRCLKWENLCVLAWLHSWRYNENLFHLVLFHWGRRTNEHRAKGRVLHGPESEFKNSHCPGVTGVPDYSACHRWLLPGECYYLGQTSLRAGEPPPATRPSPFQYSEVSFLPGSKHMGYTGRFLISFSSDTSSNEVGRRPDPA